MTFPDLILMCKYPRLGYSKSRLAADIGDGPAHDIANALLDCALADLAAYPGKKWLAAAAKDDLEPLEKRLNILHPGLDYTAIVQSGGGLGHRITAVDHAVREAGASATLYMGSDAPALTASDVSAQADLLARKDIALATAQDGGVTLMGAGPHGWPDLAPLRWSSAHLCNDLIAASLERGLSVALVDGGTDLDDHADLTSLLTALSKDTRPSRKHLLNLIRPHAKDGDSVS